MCTCVHVCEHAVWECARVCTCVYMCMCESNFFYSVQRSSIWLTKWRWRSAELTMRLCQLVEVLQGLDLAGSTAAVLLHVGCGQGEDNGGKRNYTITPRSREGRIPTNNCIEFSLPWDWFGCNEGHS